jgi:hypothetical protein
MFILMQFVGVGNCSSVQPYIATERTIVYRERFAGMYSLWAYSFAQVKNSNIVSIAKVQKLNTMFFISA